MAAKLSVLRTGRALLFRNFLWYSFLLQKNRSRTRDLQACSVVSQPLRYPVSQNAFGKRYICKTYWLENPKAREHLRDLDVNGNAILK
jgi:hypothetical protein